MAAVLISIPAVAVYAHHRSGGPTAAVATDDGDDGGDGSTPPIGGPTGDTADHTGPHLKIGPITGLTAASDCLHDGGWSESRPDDMFKQDSKSAYICHSKYQQNIIWIYRPPGTIATELCFWPGYQGSTETGENAWYLYDRIKEISIEWGGPIGPESITPDGIIPAASSNMDWTTMPQPLGKHREYCKTLPKITSNPIRIKIMSTLPPEAKPDESPHPKEPGATLQLGPPTASPHTDDDYPADHGDEYHPAISKLKLNGYTIQE